MKTTKFFLLGLAALAMTACDKEENGIQPATGDATISFVVKTSAPNQRAVGDGVDDAKITSLTAMVYAGQTQEAIKNVTDEAGVTEVKEITCKSGKDRVLVIVANSSKDFTNKSLSEVEAMTIELTEANQQAKDLIMTGKSGKIEIKPGSNHYGYPSATASDNLIAEDAPLAVTRVHAGMTIEDVTIKFQPQYAASYSFVPQHVAGLICKKTSKIFGTSLVTDEAFYLSGLQNFGGEYSPEDYTGNIEWLKKEYAQKAGFYILESDYSGASSPIHPTILCVYGKLLNASGAELTGEALATAQAAHYCDAEGMTYYPVLVNYKHENYTYTNGYEPGNNIVRNNHYQITLNITGPGTDNPEDPISETANLNVMCEVTPWVVVGQTATW